MTEATADGTPILITDLDTTMMTAGFQFEDPGELGGGGGPTAEEAEIEDIFEHWTALLSTGDQWTSYMEDDAMFVDRDHNGYYDYRD